MVSAEIAVAIIPYSPNLVPSDLFVFLKLAEHLAGNHFANGEDLKDAVMTGLNDQVAT